MKMLPSRSFSLSFAPRATATKPPGTTKKYPEASAPQHPQAAETADFLVIGGGIVGLQVAFELQKRHRTARVVVLEKEREVSAHASSRNSGVLHSGVYYAADSLKAQLTRRGNQWLHAFCEERKLRINRCGKLIVARDESELEGLAELMKRGKRNGVPLEPISEREAMELEPLVRTHREAIWSPSTAVADPKEVTMAVADAAQEAGVEIRCDTTYVGNRAIPGASSTLVETSRAQPVAGREINTIDAGHVVNCAGLYADKVAQDWGFAEHLRMLPFKGLYLYCDVPLKRLVYPVPNLSQPFLGVHFTVTVDGKTLLLLQKVGPTAIPAFWREQYQLLDNFNLREMWEVLSLETSLFFRAGFNFRELAFQEMRKYLKSYMAEGASELVRGVTPQDFTEYGRAGIRAQMIDLQTRKLVMDFLLDGDERSTHVLNAVSPAWTCSQPFAELVCDRMKL